MIITGYTSLSVLVSYLFETETPCLVQRKNGLNRIDNCKNKGYVARVLLVNGETFRWSCFVSLKRKLINFYSRDNLLWLFLQLFNHCDFLFRFQEAIRLIWFRLILSLVRLVLVHLELERDHVELITLLGLKKYIEAEDYLSLAKWSILKAESTDNSLLAKIHRNFGQLYAAQELYDKALYELALNVSIYF